jgi:predicted AAA+ superfamily ATPase
MKYYQRTLEKELEPYLTRREIIAIKGPRQAGKTTLLKQLYKRIRKKKKSRFLTFEKHTDLELFETDIENFKKLYADKYEVIFIDEFQYAKDGGKKLKYLYDTTNCKFILTGSSSLELASQTGKYLVGRLLSFELLPFSFTQYLRIKEKNLLSIIEPTRQSIHSLIQSGAKKLERSEPIKAPGIKDRLHDCLADYIVYGGYPAVVLAKDRPLKEKLLQGILDTYLLRDIRSLLQLATDDELVNLSRFLSLQIGNLIVYKELGNAAGLTFNQVKKHLLILRETYIIELLRPFFTNKRKELTKNPKVYFLDPGLRNKLASDFTPLKHRVERGALVENYVFTTLYRTISDKRSLKYWRTQTQAEVDFIVQTSGKIIPIEVKYRSSPITPGKSFYSFLDKYRPKKGLIVTRNYWGRQRINKTEVYYIPVYYM